MQKYKVQNNKDVRIRQSKPCSLHVKGWEHTHSIELTLLAFTTDERQKVNQNVLIILKVSIKVYPFIIQIQYI